MILTALSAENLLKYERVDIQGLPGKGLIAVSGANESGKSSIGEIVCFALFGRTFSLDHDEIHKLIRWGQIRCSVTLDFESRDGRAYRVSRLLDNEGNQGARLCFGDLLDDPISRGPDKVNEVLNSLVGYDFDEFVDSFYLAQREITTPHPHSQAVKTMAGIAPLERAAAEFEEDIKKRKSEIA